ncbi:hypothetical protein BD779DRAFT_1539898 [Infundibulicybe gibba]|nr:hypothetical protein BD779DRAFT_1539898 [Infundibulicybe gibba]
MRVASSWVCIVPYIWSLLTPVVLPEMSAVQRTDKVSGYVPGLVIHKAVLLERTRDF